MTGLLIMRYLSATLLVAIIAAFSRPATTADQFQLMIEVSDVPSARGFVIIAIYTNRQDFPRKPFDVAMTAIVDGTAVRPFWLPPGEYAVIAFQDVNSSGSLDRHWYGLPTEPLVISGEPGRWGLPRWKRAHFSLQKDMHLALSLTP